DGLSAADQIETASGNASLAQTIDALVLPALVLAANDARSGRLSHTQAVAVRDALDEAIELSPELGNGPGTDDVEKDVLIVPARGDVDVAAARFLARIVTARSSHSAAASSHATGLTAIATAAELEQDSPP